MLKEQFGSVLTREGVPTSGVAGLLCEEKGNERPLLTAGSIEPSHGAGVLCQDEGLRGTPQQSLSFSSSRDPFQAK